MPSPARTPPPARYTRRAGRPTRARPGARTPAGRPGPARGSGAARGPATPWPSSFDQILDFLIAKPPRFVGLQPAPAGVDGFRVRERLREGGRPFAVFVFL